jgi:hypothetical protein
LGIYTSLDALRNNPDLNGKLETKKKDYPDINDDFIEFAVFEKNGERIYRPHRAIDRVRRSIRLSIDEMFFD